MKMMKQMMKKNLSKCCIDLITKRDEEEPVKKKTTKSKRIQGEVKRCVFLKMARPGEPDKDGIVVDNNGFVALSDDSDGEQIDLPFS